TLPAAVDGDAVALLAEPIARTAVGAWLGFTDDEMLEIARLSAASHAAGARRLAEGPSAAPAAHAAKRALLEKIGGDATLLVEAGLPTIADSITGALHALARFPQPIEDPDRAAHELLRFHSPIKQFARWDTATNQQTIVWFISVNRDSSVFKDP